jgi:CheY-like chemotaxis protein
MEVVNESSLARTSEILTPRILVLDDERQIHAALRLRLGRHFELTFAAKPSEALRLLADAEFDLCFVDIQMPEMDGLTFIKRAAEVDEELGFVILTAYDTDENLRRAIPLQVYDFLAKPIPERGRLEAQLPDWIRRTRDRRQSRKLAGTADAVLRDLDAVRLEREVELVASECARDALSQAAGLLSTVNAHLANATSYLAERGKGDPLASRLWRGLEEAKKASDAAAVVVETFFDSSYGNRDSSPALVATGVRNAANIAARLANSDESNKVVDIGAVENGFPIRSLSGLEFLLVLVPLLEAALLAAPANSTIRVGSEMLPRLDAALEGVRGKQFYWLNRRSALVSQPGMMLTIATAAPALDRAAAEAWLNGEASLVPRISTGGLVRGIRKARGLFGLSVQPLGDAFRLVLVLPA